MRFVFKNLGKIKYAELKPNDLTLICGENNSGKTYITYALYGFYRLWPTLIHIELPQNVISELFEKGNASFDIGRFVKEHITEIINNACKQYVSMLPRVFAASEARFKETEFSIDIENDELDLSFEFHGKLNVGQKDFLTVDKNINSLEVTFGYVVESESRVINTAVIEALNMQVVAMLFSNIFTRSYIASTERTGAAIFRNELDFARNRLLEELGTNKNKSAMEILLTGNVYQPYPLPVRVNVEFTRNLEAMNNADGYIYKNYPQILEQFSDIIGGKYITKNDDIYYEPSKGHTKLKMSESSSSVRALVDFGYYLRHKARKGDLIFIDEPEMNLHPKNQRKMARLFVQLVNIGMKVFVTTHSDYIVRELNTLIMLHQNTDHLIKVANDYGYSESEKLSPKQIGVFVAKDDKVRVSNAVRRRTCPTLVPVKIDPKYGMAITAFDETIEIMNKIQDEILWGE